MARLCEKIGARPTGSAKNKEAVDYVFEVFQKCGFQVRRQEFSCIDWVNSGATLLVDGQVVSVEPAEYSLLYAQCKVLPAPYQNSTTVLPVRPILHQLSAFR